jgi:hypothetical protein
MTSSKGKERAMQSLADDVSRLSIASTTSALAQIQSARDLSNEDHQALDKDVLKSFGMYIKFKRVPSWDFLLCNIVNNDGRPPRLTIKQAEELVERESSLIAVLQKGWDDHSFKEVRRLGMLPCSPLDH